MEEDLTAFKKPIGDNVEGRGNECSGVDDGIFAYEDPVGIDKIHLAVGLEIAEELREVLSTYFIDDNRIAAGLNEFDELFGVYRKILPVDERFMAGGNMGLLGGILEKSLSKLYLGTSRSSMNSRVHP